MNTILWSPLNKKEVLATGPKEAEMYQKAFGPFPIILSDRHLPILKGMAYAGIESADDLVAMIEEFKEIQLSLEA